MKIGKRKLTSILSKEKGFTKEEIRIYGRYECYGNKEMITIGAHTIVALNGEIKIYSPVFGRFEDDIDEIRYEAKVIEG